MLVEVVHTHHGIMDARGILYHERIQNISISLSNYKKQKDNFDNGDPIPTALIYNTSKSYCMR